jgi:hypothetical protein
MCSLKERLSVAANETISAGQKMGWMTSRGEAGCHLKRITASAAIREWLRGETTRKKGDYTRPAVSKT